MGKEASTIEFYDKRYMAALYIKHERGTYRYTCALCGRSLWDADKERCIDYAIAHRQVCPVQSMRSGR